MTEAEARRLIADAKAAGRRDDAVAHVRELYLRTKDPGLWAVARDAFTAPELEGMSPPDATTIGPEKEPLLPRRPYADVLLGSLKAPFASGSAIFVLVVSAPLMLGALVSIRIAGAIGLLIAAFLYGYLLAFLFDVLRQAAEGRDRGPRLLTLLWADEGSRFEFVFFFANWLGAALAAFWPCLLLMSSYYKSPSVPLGAALAVTGLAGVVWHPIALAQAGFGNGFSAFNYPRAFERIRRLGADYWRCAAFFVATNAAVIGFQWAIAQWSEAVEERQGIARLFLSWATYASWLVQARAVGLLCWARGDVR